MNQTVDRLPVHVGDEVSGVESGFLGRTSVLHMLREEVKREKCVSVKSSLDWVKSI